MKQVAVFSDVHGNATAFRAMVADAKKQGADEYWFLGDLLMPGPGVAEVWQLLQELAPTKLVRGNWDDLVIHGARGEIDLAKPSHVYFARLAQYVAGHLPAGAVDQMAAWPLTAPQASPHMSLPASIGSAMSRAVQPSSAARNSAAARLCPRPEK